MKPYDTSLKGLLLILVALTLTPASVANVIVNGDFETGDFAGWTSGGTGATVSDTSPLAGTWSAVQTASGGSLIDQGFTAITTAATASFEFTVNDVGGAGDRSMNVYFGESFGVSDRINLRIVDVDDDGDGDVQVFNGAWTTRLTDAVVFGEPTTLSLTFNDYGAGANYDLTVGGSTATGLTDFQNAAPDHFGGITFVASSLAAGSTFTFDNVSVAAESGPDTTPPTLAGTDPVDGATGVPVSGTLEATFSETVALTGSGSITFKNLSGGADIPVTLPGDVSISGVVLTIVPASDLVGGEEYAVEISSDAIEDLSATPNPYAGLLATDDPNWSFTADGTPPTKGSMGPAADATNVSPFVDLTLSFDEDVLAGSGNITIHLASDNSVVETIAADDPKVIISGSGVTIDISVLAEGTAYYVNIDDGAFTDLSGNAYAGIGDSATWAFTTRTNPTGVIFEETFSGSGDLNGTAPDVTTFGATWTASAWQKDGSIFDRASPGSDSAWLPFVPVDGQVYTLVVTLDALASGSSASSWTAMGFGAGSDTSSFWQSPNATSPWVLYRATQTPDEIVSWIGPGVTGNVSHGTVAGPVTLSIVLDTTGAQWTAEWFEGSNSLRTETYTTNPTITHVGFGRSADSDGPISHFSLLSSGGFGGPAITSITAIGGGLFELTLLGAAETDYEFRSSTTLAFDPGILLENLADGVPAVGTIGGSNDSVITTDGDGNATVRVALSGPRNFVRAQDPPPLFFEDFEEDNGGFASTGEWEWGDPDSNNGFGLEILTGNPDTGNCWATNLGLADDGVITPATNSVLRSPDIDLSAVFGAQLQFAAAVDLKAGDKFEVLVREVGTNVLLDTIIPAALPDTSTWSTRGPFDLSAADNRNIYLEFRFQGVDETYIGVYFDDVMID